MSRAEKKAAAAERRRQYRIRWADLGKRVGFPMRKVLEAISNDAAHLMRETPTLKSEIQLALDEFVDLLALAAAKTLKDNPPSP